MNSKELKSDLLNSISDIEDTSILLELQTFLQQKLQQPKTNKEQETELLLKINDGLTPEAQERYIKLSQKSVNQTLNKVEHQEFLQLIEQTEKKAVYRLKHLIELSKLWNTTVDVTMNRLQISTPPVIHA